MLMMLLTALWSTPIGDPQVQEEMTVHYATMVVRVLDKQHQPVTGLTKADFKLKVDGRWITQFDLIEQDFTDVAPPVDNSAETVQTPAPQRTLAFLIDATLLRYKMFEETKTALHQMIDRLGPGDLVRLYYGDRTLTALTPFTKDKAVLHHTVDQLAFKPYFQERMHDIELNMAEANIMMGEGKRGNDEMKIIEAEATINSMTVIRAKVLEGQFQTRAQFLNAVSDDLKRIPGPKAAYMFSGGGVNPSNGLAAFNTAARGLNQAGIPLNVFSFNRRPQTDGESAHDSRAFISAGAMHAAASAYAQETGGELVQISGKAHLNKMVDRVLNATAHQYQLSFQTEKHVKTVKVTYAGSRKGLDVKYGKHPGHRETLDQNEAEEANAFQTRLVYAPAASTLPTQWSKRVFRDHEGLYRVVVFGRIQEPSSNAGAYRVGFAAFNDRDLPIDIRTTRLEKLDGSFRDLLICPEPPAKIRYAVREQATGLETIFEEQTKFEPKANGFDLSDVVLGRPRAAGSLPLHFHTGEDTTRATTRRQLDPFLVNGQLLSADTGSIFSPGVLTAYFFLENVTEPLNQYKLAAQLDSDDRTYQPTIKPVIVKKLDDTTVQLPAEVDVSALEPGDYNLSITVQSPDATRHNTQAVTLKAL